MRTADLPDTKQISGSPEATPTASRFPLGQIVATKGAVEALLEAKMEADQLLLRHLKGDWGDLCESDKRLNEQALKEQTRLLSSYLLTTGEKIWIITEADRSVTTLLTPSEY